MPHIRAALRGALLTLPFAAALMAPGAAQAAPSASFTFSPATPQTLEAVTFTSTSTGVVAPQRWDLDGDTACDDATGSVVQRAFPVAAAYSVKLCVTDGVDEATATRRVTVLNRPPVASFAYAPPMPMTGDPVGFASTANDPDGPIVSEQWDLDGDGAFDDSGGTIATVTFSTPGPHIVRLVVTDRDGAVGVATAMITVTRASAPTAVCVPPRAHERPGHDARDHGALAHHQHAARHARAGALHRARLPVPRASRSERRTPPGS